MSGLPPLDLADRLVDELRVGLGVVAAGDEARGGAGGGIGGRRAQFVDRGALLGGDLLLGDAAAALDQRLGVGLGLGDDLVGLVLRALQQGLAVLVDRLRLRLIFGL